MSTNTQHGVAITNFADAVAAFSGEHYTAEELAWALAFRQSVLPDTTLRRRDHCPHVEVCPDLQTCLRYLAWYRRHQQAIERAS
jgi:hypothetical protein